MHQLLARLLAVIALVGMFALSGQVGPTALGAGTGGGDPALHQQILVNGAPLVNAPVTVVAVPVDKSSWRSDAPFPQVGSGATDQNGYVDANLDPNLDGIQGNPAFENESDGHVTLAVDYTDSSGNAVQGFTADEYLTPYDDPALASQTVTSDGAPVSGASLVVNAEPQYTEQWPSGAAYPQVGTCQTDGEGRPQCALDIRSLEGDGNFDQRGVLTFDVWQTTSNGPQLAFRTQEYVDAGWDVTLLEQQLLAPGGGPIANTPIEVRALPAGRAAASTDTPVLGQGATDGQGLMQVQVDPNPVLNDPTYDPSGSVALEVDYKAPDGSWQPGSTYLQAMGPNPEPAMDRTGVNDASGNPVPNTSVLARLEPVNPSTWAGGDYPLVGIGTTDSSGKAVLTPALQPYVGDTAFETANQVMIVDLYQEAAGGGWAFVTRVPYYFGAASDPALLQSRMDDGSGSPVRHERTIIRVVPVDPSAWSPGKAYPVVGTGYVDGVGAIHSRIDLRSVQGNAALEDSTGAVKLQAYHTPPMVSRPPARLPRSC